MGTTINLRKLLPTLYSVQDLSGDWERLCDDVIEPLINRLLSGTAEPAARYTGAPVSVDDMNAVWDPLVAEERLQPYIAHRTGWDLDTTLPAALKRKVVSLAGALLRERGTKQGIVDGMRLLLGLEVDIWELWPDAWQLSRDQLGVGTVLGPAALQDGYSRG